MKWAVQRLAAVFSGVMFALLRAAAWIFAPFGVGRLLRTVSIPRMREHPLRTSLTLLGIAMGVAVLVAVLIVNRSIELGVTASVDDLAGKADLQIGAGSSGVDEALLDKLRAIPGIFKLTPVVQQTTTLVAKDGTRERLLMLGIDLIGTEDSYFRKYDSKELDAIRRDSLEFLNSATNILLSRALAQRLSIKLHDKVSIHTDRGIQAFEVWGFIDNTGAGRAFGNAVAVMYYPAMQVSFGRGRNVDRIEIAVEPGTDVERVARAVQHTVGAAFTVERPATRGDRISKMLLSMRTSLTTASLVALIAGAFMVINTMSVSVIQRKRELGTLRALGSTRGQLRALITLEGALLGVVGSALGIAIGLVLSGGMLEATSHSVSEIFLEVAVPTVRLDVTSILAAFLLGTLSAIVAAYVATRRADGASPAEIRTPTASPSAERHTSRSAADVVGVALLLASFGLLQIPAFGMLPIGALAAMLTLILAARALMPRMVAGVHRLVGLFRRRMNAQAALANDNLTRDLARTASTASGLMVGVALTVGVATFIAAFLSRMDTWASQTVPGDLFVTRGAALAGLGGKNLQMSDAMRAELAAIPGVARVRPIRISDIDFRGMPIKLMSTDIAQYVQRAKFMVLDGSSDSLASALMEGSVAVSENLARHFDIRPGQQIALSTKDGTRSFTVAAVVVDYTNDKGTIIMDRGTFIRHWSDDRTDTYELYAQSEASVESVRQAINARMGEQNDLFVLTNREFRKAFAAVSENVFALLRVLELVTLFVAGLGLMTAVFANVLDRVHEFGVLRAIGMLRAEVRNMVILESTLVGSVGTLTGLLIGNGIGYILLRHVTTVQFGWYLPYRVPLTTMVALILGTIPFAALAGLFPSRQAAALRVVDALDYE